MKIHFEMADQSRRVNILRKGSLSGMVILIMDALKISFYRYRHSTVKLASLIYFTSQLKNK